MNLSVNCPSQTDEDFTIVFLKTIVLYNSRMSRATKNKYASELNQRLRRCNTYKSKQS